jgi:putative membrane-bound dehydrogenase-like protein
MRMSLALSFALVLSPVHAQVPVMEPGPKSPAESLGCLKARPGFTVELMAAEPLVMSPVAFAWGADGKFWVVEMGDYPLGIDGKNKFGGKVKFLEKTKPDGPYDKASVFLDGLGFPTGVTPWGKGVIVTCAPDIFYAEDTDGDGKADKKVVLFTGFKEGNPQHRVNGLVYGLDNWLYGANGDSGGKIKSIKTGAEVNINGRDFRIKPDEGLIEAVSGQTQFGRARDDWGNWFGNNNSNPMYHYVLEDRYLKRNPHVLYPDVRVQVSEKPGAAEVFPISKPLPRFNNPQSVNHFTSACSAIVYRDDLFGPEFANNTFVSEPVHNLVHREIMTPKGVTFTSKRPADEQTSEFLASTDNWFRPTTIQTGPDGALWVADMYRYVIEHPEWIPKDWQKKLDLRAGHDKGRIYRVYPAGKKPREIPRLDKMNVEERVAALESPNGWTRDMAQQLIVPEDKGKAKKLLQTPSTNPLARLHALVTLAEIDELEPLQLAIAFRDQDPAVRRQAIRVGYSWFDLMWRERNGLVEDRDPQVRLQLAYSLGEWKSPLAGKALGQLLAKSADDKYLVAAVMSSVNAANWERMIQEIQSQYRGRSMPPTLMGPLLRLVQVHGSSRGTALFLAAVADAEGGKVTSDQFFTLGGLLDILEEKNASLQKLNESGDIDLKNVLLSLGKVFAAARKTALDVKAPLNDRSLAIRLLGRGLDNQKEDIETLTAFLSPQHSDELRLSAMETLNRLPAADAPRKLIVRWKGYGPKLRTETLDILLAKSTGTSALLNALEAKEILAVEMDSIRRQRLLDHKNPTIRARAAKIFAGSVNGDRAKVIESYRPALALAGDAARGSKVFAKTCAACHQLGGIGQRVGPDLASVGDKTPEGLLIAILDPNRAVEARYVNYVANTKAGLTVSGLLEAETSTTITMVSADGKKHDILRADLEELFSTGKSAMPDGLEKEVPQQEMADLIAFLRGNLPSAKPKRLEGNLPALVKPDDKGVLRLLPANGAIYGKTLILEKQHGNLGYWSSEDDHVVWTLDVPAAGTYAVELEWACADDSAGNVFTLQAEGKKLTHKVAGTGTWDDYKVIWISTVALTEGKVEVTMRSQGAIRGALIDLKGIYLVPKK